jgi:putative spermidine/putrescine transport system permease protein
MIRLYGRPPILLIGSPALLIAGYVVLSLPYMFRAVDTGLRAIDVRTLTEAALSLGAGWRVILTQVIFPNLRVAILSGVFLTFAIVMGEFTFASLLAWPAFGPYIEEMGSMRAYVPQALSVVSFMMTWISIGILQWIGRGAADQQVAGAH